MIIDRWLLLVDDECDSCKAAKAIKIVLDEAGYGVIISCNCPECLFNEEFAGVDLPRVIGTSSADIIRMIAEIMKENRRQ